MLASDFHLKIRKLNKSLRIFCGDDSKKAAGLFHVINGEYTAICGVDKNWLPEHPIVDETGRIVKTGWRRPLRILIGNKLVDRRKAERVFGTQLVGVRSPNNTRRYVDPINKAIDEAVIHNFEKVGNPALRPDEIMDFAKEIEKCK